MKLTYVTVPEGEQHPGPGIYLFLGLPRAPHRLDEIEQIPQYAFQIIRVTRSASGRPMVTGRDLYGPHDSPMIGMWWAVHPGAAETLAVRSFAMDALAQRVFNGTKKRTWARTKAHVFDSIGAHLPHRKPEVREAREQLAEAVWQRIQALCEETTP